MTSQYRKNELKQPVAPKKKISGNEDEIEVEIVDEENDEDDEDEADKVADEFIMATLNAIPTIDVAVGKFVYVGCEAKKATKTSHYAGQITKVTSTEEVEISFLTKSRNTYMWPSPLTLRTVDADDIHLELVAPSITHRDHLLFSEEDTSAMNLCCSH